MYADFMWVIRLSRELKGKRYMYIVRPLEEEENQIEGSISNVKRSIAKLEKKLETQLKTQSQKICTEVADFQVSSLDSLNQKVNTVQDEIKDLGNKMDALMKMMQQKI